MKDAQELRKELQNVKKLARERAKAITLRIPQLKDCKNHFDKKKEKGKGTMVFICEGQSAAGSITSCRDVNNQAVFVLKGKPLNVWDLKRDIMYKNDEMYNLMQSLNVEDNTEGLRYDKVILATDADVDGMHIRNLMITYFFQFFEQLVHDGHVYVLETPLFRVRTGKSGSHQEKTIYCYSETERDNAVKELSGAGILPASGTGVSPVRAKGQTDDSGAATEDRQDARPTRRIEITRFKGLGEISPKEFAQFIGKEMRLSKVEYAPRAESARSSISIWVRTRRVVTGGESRMDAARQLRPGPLGHLFSAGYWNDTSGNAGQVVTANGNKAMRTTSSGISFLNLRGLSIQETQTCTLFFRIIPGADTVASITNIVGLTDKRQRSYGGEFINLGPVVYPTPFTNTTAGVETSRRFFPVRCAPLGSHEKGFGPLRDPCRRKRDHYAPRSARFTARVRCGILSALAWRTGCSAGPPARGAW